MTTLTNYSNENTTLKNAFGFEDETTNFPLTAIGSFGSGTNITLNENFIFDKDVIKQVLFAISSQDNLLLWGDAGAGKTDMVEQVAARLNRQSFVISFGEETSVGQLVGTFTISQGETPFREGGLLKAIQVPNAIVCLDEINMASSGVVATLNHLLQKREIIIPQTGETIPCAEGVCFMATSNTNMGIDEGGLFEGSQSQNAATRSRFRALHVKYLAPEDELRLIKKAYPELDEHIAALDGKDFSQLTVQVANSLRASLRDGGLSVPFSVRQVHGFIQASLAFKSLDLAFKYSYWNLLDSIEREAAGSIFQTVFNIEISE